MFLAKKKEELVEKINKLRDVVIKHWAKASPADHLYLIEGGEKALTDLEKKVREVENFEVGLIGQSQIGKSTLLNALIGDEQYPYIFPSGGTGPLTAVEIAVNFGSKRRLFVTYHGADKLNQVVFGLKKSIEAKSSSSEEDVLNENEKLKATIAQITVLVTGDQHEKRETEYLIKICESLVSKKKLEEVETLFEQYPADKVAYKKVLNVMKMESRKATFIEGQEHFLEAINDHSAGCLSSLVNSLKLTWPAEVLQNNVVISDLPGVGTVNDSFPIETQKWLQGKCRSVILVVKNNGIDKESADILTRSGFFHRLMWSLDNPEEDPVQLIIAVTHMDSLVNQVRKKSEIPAAFSQKCEDMKGTIISQLETVFNETIKHGGKAEEDLKQDRLRILERVIKNVTIVPLSAQSYLHTLTEDFRSIFDKENIHVTNVPLLKNEIITSSQTYFEEVERRLDRGWLQCQKQISLAIEQVLSRLTSSLASDSVTEQISADFKELATELKRSLAARQAEFRSYVTKTVPAEIELVVAQAESEASRNYSDYVRRELTEEAHWMTLKAVVVRKGSYNGKKNINLPETVANMMADRIPSKFQNRVIKSTRQEGRNLIEAHKQCVEKAINWIEEKKIPKSVKDDIEVIKMRLVLESEAMDDAGKEALANLKNAVKENLKAEIEESISDSLDSFRKSSASSGTGVKGRMLDLFDRAGIDALNEARDQATKLIQNLYNEIFKEIITQSLKIYKKDLIQEVQEVMESASVILAEKEREKQAKEIKPRIKELESMKQWMSEI